MSTKTQKRKHTTDLQMPPTFLTSGRIHSSDELPQILAERVNEASWIKTGKKIEYLNCPLAFDIETTSFYDNWGDKAGCMYEWTVGINGEVIIGRTWEDLLQLFDELARILDLSSSRRVIVFVHNLAFEMQWICYRFDWEKVFAVDHRKPLYALTTTGIEFRCSYMLSGYSLAKLGDELVTYPVQKMVGDLDYKLYRHAGTPLTDKELKYCENDVRVVMSYIQQEIERNGDIGKIPLTNTGYVRKYCRDETLYVHGDHKKNNKKFWAYRNLMSTLTLDPPLLAQCIRAFQGGFTHGNPFYTEELLADVGSIDFTSAYPAVMVMERKFPMGSCEDVVLHSVEDFENNIRRYFCMFDVEIEGLQAITFFDNYLSASKCKKLTNPLLNNGRVVEADSLITTMTDIDFQIFRRVYKWTAFKVYNFHRWRRGYLPTDLVKAIIKLYKDKTALKNLYSPDPDEDAKIRLHYGHAKSMLNATYGCTVTSVLMSERTFTREDGWTETMPDPAEACEKYNTNIRRFLYYPWGIAVTALNRYNLWSGILRIGAAGDFVYSDTDSIKFLHPERHMDYIEAYNKAVEAKLRKACEYHGIPFEDVCPKSKDGKEHMLGAWDYEGTYDYFKFLGAKRYATYKDGKFSITVSGVNKKVAAPWLRSQAEKIEDVFALFDDGLYIPKECTGKNTHTYIDYPQAGTIVDYMGNKGEYSELSSVHLEESDYSMSIASDYLSYLAGIRLKEE